MNVLIFAAAAVACTPVGAWLGRRKMRRDAARWRLRMQMARLTADFEAMAVQIGSALLPAVRNMATAFGAFAAAVTSATTNGDSQ